MKPEIPELTGREGRLEHVRRLRNWSIHDLAEIAGVGRNTAWHWVTGRVRRVGNHEAIQAIAQAANVDVSWLITGKGSPERHTPLSDEETRMLEAIRALPQKWRIFFIDMAVAAANAAEED